MISVGHIGQHVAPLKELRIHGKLPDPPVHAQQTRKSSRHHIDQIPDSDGAQAVAGHGDSGCIDFVVFNHFLNASLHGLNNRLPFVVVGSGMLGNQHDAFRLGNGSVHDQGAQAPFLRLEGGPGHAVGAVEIHHQRQPRLHIKRRIDPVIHPRGVNGTAGRHFKAFPAFRPVLFGIRAGGDDEKDGKQKGNEQTGDSFHSQNEPSLLCSDSALKIRKAGRGNASCGRWFHPSREDRQFRKRRRGWIPGRKWRCAWARARNRFSGPRPGCSP